MNRSISALVVCALGACSQASGQVCTNLCLQQTSCSGNGTTTVTGTVYAPNGVDPLPNVLVYVPNSAVAPYTPGVTCQAQGQPASGSPLVSAFTAVNGTFTLTNVPVGSNIPLVIQTGRWRRQLVIPNVTACTNTALTAGFARLPQKQSEGDIPKIAVVTGSVDGLECILRKIGIADSEFTDPTGTGRINFYNGETSGASIDSNTPGEAQLWTADANGNVPINNYDIVLFPCQGSAHDKTAATQQNVIDYANAGGRIFATHYSYLWLYNDAPFSGTAAWHINQNAPTPDPQTGSVNQSFAKGMQLAQWLKLVGASTTLGEISLNTLRHDQDGVIAPTQSWLTINSPSETMQLTFNTPVGMPAQNQCGRVLFNEYHVENQNGLNSSVIFPAECPTGGLTPQERLLEFSLFDLSTFVSPDTPPTVSVTLTNSPTAFTQGDTSPTVLDSININVTNTSATDPTNPSLTVTATLPPGLTAAQMYGAQTNTGWICTAATLTCNRTGGLSANTSDPITLVVNVSQTAAVGLLPVSAMASGGGLVAGVTGSENINIQTAAPTITSPASGFSQTSSSVTVTGTANANASITIFDGASQVGSGSANGSGNFSIGITLAIGSHSLTATQTVNSTTSAASTAVTGSIAPGAPTITSPTSGFSQTSTSVTVTGTANANATVTIFDGSSQAFIGSANGSGNFSFAITLGIGNHSLTAEQMVGRTTSVASTAVTGTIAPPAPMITSPPSGFSQAGTSINVSGSANANAAITIFDGASQVGTGSATSGGAFSIGITLTIGTHSLTATQTVNSIASAATTAVTGTIAPPAPVIDSPSSGFNQTSTSITVAGTANANAAITIYDGAIQVGSGSSDGSGNFSIGITLGIGSHSLTAKQTVNSIASAASAAVNGTIAPPAPTISSPSSGFSQTNTSVTMTGNGNANALITIFDGASQVGTGPANGSGAFSFGITLGIGTHSLTANQTVSSVASAASNTVTGTIAPVAPTITSPTSGFNQTSTSVTVAGTANPNASITVLDGGSQVMTGTANGSGNFSIGITLAIGTHPLTATQTVNSVTSAASNTVTGTISPPAPSITSPTTGFNQTSTSVTVAGTALPNASIAILDGGSQVMTGTANGSGNFSIGITLTIGTHSLTATQTVNSITSAASNTVTGTISPSAPSITSPTSGFSQTTTPVTVAGTALPNASITILDGVSQVMTGTANSSGNFSIGITLAIGSHSLTATQTVNAVTSAASNTVTGTIAPPAPTITSPMTGFSQTSTSVTVAGSANPNASITIFDGISQVGTGSANSSGNFSIGITLVIGSHSLTATQTVNSITSAASTAVTGSISPVAPTITSPTSGFSQTSTSLTVTGTAIPTASITIFDGVSQVGTGSANSSGNFSIAITLAIGSHSLTATQTFSSVTSAASTAVTGSIAPVAPTITSPATGFSQTSTSVTVVGTAIANASITIFDGVSQVGTGTADGTGHFSIVITLAIGSHSLTATQTVNTVTSAASTAVTGSIAPAAPTITSPTTGFSQISTSLTVAGSANPNAAITIYDGISQVGTGSANVSGNFSISITLPIGVHSLTAKQTVNSVISAASNTVTGMIGPSAPVITSPTSGFSQTSTSVTVAGTALANASITIFDGLSQAGTGTANVSGNFSIVITLAIGNHSLTATQTVNGVTSAASNTVTGTIAPPAPTITSPANGFSRPPNSTITVGGTALPNASITIYDNNSPIATGTADSTGHFSISITLALGSHSLTATQTVSSITSAASNAVSGTIQTGTPPPAQSYQDSFEQGYTVFNNGVGVARVRSSGSTSETDYAPGIAASDGSFYARLVVQPGNNINNAQTTVCSPGALNLTSFSCVGPFSEWGLPFGGLDGKFDTGVPISGPSQTSIDIYLDTKFAASAAGQNSDYRFDWDSSLLDKKGVILQDYVFNVATAVPPEVSGCSNGFVIEASNNSQRSGGGTAHNPAPPNPGQACITKSGWYTFSHLFRKDPNGNLAVDMTITSIPGNTAVAQWTLHPTCQSTQASAGLCTLSTPLPFSAVGYNFEGSFPDQEINDLAVDNIRKNP